MLTLGGTSTLGDSSTLEALDLSHTTGLNQSLCSSIAYGLQFEAFEAFKD
jgi:hypothetical protein